MTVYVVTKTLYATDCHLVDDLGHHVNCLSELVGVYPDENTAMNIQEDLLNGSDLEVVPYNEELDPFTTYIDVTVETTQLTGWHKR